MFKIIKPLFFICMLISSFSMLGNSISIQPQALIDKIVALKADPTMAPLLQSMNVLLILNIMEDFVKAVSKMNTYEFEKFRKEVTEYISFQCQHDNYELNSQSVKSLQVAQYVCKFIQSQILPQYPIQELMVFNILFDLFEDLFYLNDTV